MRRALIALALLTLFVIVTTQHPEAQMSGATGEFVHEQDTAPTSTGIAWTRNLDRQTFEYSDSLAKWVGQPFVVWASKNSAGISGALKFGQACNYDSASIGTIGWPLPETMQLFRVVWNASNADTSPPTTTPNCTTNVFVRGTMDTTWMLGKWGGVSDIVFPSGAVADSGAILTVYLSPDATAPVNPNNPNIWLEFRAVVAP